MNLSRLGRMTCASPGSTPADAIHIVGVGLAALDPHLEPVPPVVVKDEVVPEPCLKVAMVTPQTTWLGLSILH